MRWTVIYHHEFSDGSTAGGDPDTHHRTYAGADFYRRFRYHHQGMGSCWVTTEITPALKPWYGDQWERIAQAISFVERRRRSFIGGLRDAWYGLRYGR